MVSFKYKNKMLSLMYIVNDVTNTYIGLVKIGGKKSN